MESLIIGSFSNKISSSYSFPFPVAASVSPLLLSATGGSCQVSVRPTKCCCVIRSQSSLVRHNVRSFHEKCSLFQKRKAKYVANAASEHPIESDPKSPQKSLRNALDAFYRFSRPHTVIGTALSIVSVSLLAVEKLSDFSPLFFTGVLEAIAAAFFMNIYIVGLNQITDIEIDKVNKPYLPLASGEYSVKTGIMIVSSFAIMVQVLANSKPLSDPSYAYLMVGFLLWKHWLHRILRLWLSAMTIRPFLKSFWLGWIVGSWPLFWALFISFLLGTAYSINIPMLRWKRFALVAAMCILAVRAIIVQIAFYLHIQNHVFGRPALFPKSVIFATGFMSFFSVVIALFKDIPDIVGDKIYGIQSFTVKLGQKRVFWICISLLEVAYGVAILVGASSPLLWSKYITVLGHAILGLMLWGRAKSSGLESKAAITSFYMFIWKLFYAEYLLIPLVR